MNLSSTQFQLSSFLYAVKYNFNIMVNLQMQNSHVIQSVFKHSTSTDYDGMHINFDAVYQGGSKFVHETRKTQTAHIGFFSNMQADCSNIQ